jgi:hypothetical protein
VLTKKQRENLAKLIFDLGKLTFAGLVIGTLLPDKKFAWLIFSIGCLFSFLCFVIGAYLDK